MKKKIIIGLTIAIIAGLLFSAAAAVFYFTQRVSYAETLNAGVSAQVSIRRDKHGVPLIKAESAEDMYFALGYLHAQDMLALMEYYRALATGNAKQVLGRQGDSLEKLAHIIGFKRLSAGLILKMKETELAYLKAYTSGINFSKSGGKILKNNISLDWDPADVIAVYVMLEWTNSYLNNRELIFQIPYGKSLTLQKGFFPENITKVYKEGEEAALAIVNNLKDLLVKYVGPFNRGMAFYISGKNMKNGQSAAGYTLNNNLSVYPGWYTLHVELPEIKISAVTHAGIPFIFSGIRGDFSFFRVSADIDTQDIFTENVKKINEQIVYQTPGGWKKLNPVRDSGGAENYLIWETDNGPVINDIFSNEEYANYVVTIRSHFPDETAIASMFAVPFSMNMKEAENSAASAGGSPAVYLFSSGDTALKLYSGRLPRTPDSNLVFRPGLGAAKPDMIDLSRYRYTHLDRSVIISSGSAADLPADIRGFCLGDNSLTELFEETAGRNILMKDDDVHLLLRDTSSSLAKKFVPLFVSLLSANPVTSSKLARLYFSDWNFRFDPAETAPTIYYSLLLTFLQETLADDYPISIGSIIKNHKYILPSFYELAKNGQSPYFNDIQTDNFETRDNIFDKAFLKSMRVLNRKMGPVMDKWRWGNIHRGHFRIPYNESFIFGKSLYSIEDTEFAGAPDSFAYADTDPELVPISVASMSLYDMKSRRGIIMGYSYSINPVSEFYYGKRMEFHDKNFNRHNGIYLTVIRPVEKKDQIENK